MEECFPSDCFQPVNVSFLKKQNQPPLPKKKINPTPQTLKTNVNCHGMSAMQDSWHFQIRETQYSSSECILLGRSTTLCSAVQVSGSVMWGQQTPQLSRHAQHVIGMTLMQTLCEDWNSRIQKYLT